MKRIVVNIKQKKYGRTTLIKDVYFELLPGESCLLIGTSGAGKSTIENAVLGFSRFKGDVEYGSKDTKIAYIAQHPALNDRETVYQAVYYAGRYDDRSIPLEEVKMSAEQYISLLGLDYVRDKKISKLSGGQRQRVAIATELIRNADVLICDEPDTGLDFGVSRALARHFDGITKHNHMATLVVSHNVFNAPLYDKLLVLAKDEKKIGGIAYWGPPKAALSYFNVTDYGQILEKINPKEEDGAGLGGYYIQKYKDLHHSS